MISILIVDTHKITRDILFHLVAHTFPDAVMHVTARFESAMELCRIFKVNIVITTISVPPERSDSMLASLRSIEYNPIKIIIMTPESQTTILDTMREMPNTYVICQPLDMNYLLSLITERISEIELG